uniref:Uncharacterized protein n=1 Tax=Ditylenchus dipsaci TaxID=166011 RepID=A0A915CTD5_9BILA
MENDEVEEDHSATAEVQQGEMDEEVQQPKPMDLVRQLLGENDSVARIRCLIKIFELLIKLAKVKSEKLLQYIRVENYTREIIRLCSKPIAAVVAIVKNHLENIQFANVLPIRNPGMWPKNSSLGNVHELVRDPRKINLQQWKMAPVNSFKAKSTLKCRKVPEVRTSSRSRSRQQVFPNNNFDRFLQLDDDNIEDDLDDDSDDLSLPSSTTGISTLNSDDKNRISTLEAQLAQLQAQLQFLMNAQTNQAGGDGCSSMRNGLPSLVSSCTSSEPPPKRVSPPPAPPLPPPDFLKTKRPLQPDEVKFRPAEQVLKVETEKPKKAAEVDRSPNGTPMRGQ